MVKLKINYSDCLELAETVFVEPVSVWVNLAPETPIIEVVKLLESDEYDFEEFEDDDLDELNEWERDLYLTERNSFDKLNSWKESVQIEKAPGFESFRWVEDFINDIVAPRDSNAAAKIARSIGGRESFGRFKTAVDVLGYLNDWYQYNRKRQTDYVVDQLRDAGIEIVEKDGLPIVES